MAEEIITHLHLSCYLVVAEVFMCFIVFVILNKSALTGNYTNVPRITAAFSENGLLDVLTTFKLMICMNSVKKPIIFVFTKILGTKKFY